MDTLRRDLALALRHLRRRPGFTLVAAVSLAVGIGANAAVFTVVNAFLIRDLPFRAPEQLVEVYTSDSSIEHATSSWPDYADIAALPVFEAVVAYNLTFARIAGPEGSTLVPGEIVSANYFDVLGVPLQLGRGFLPEEDRTPGTHPVVIVSDGYWRRELGARADVLDQELRLGSTSFRIVGVAAPEHTGMLRGVESNLWVPMMMQNVIAPSDTDVLTERGSRSLFLKARLADGITVEQANAALAALGTALASTYPDTNANKSLSALPTLEVAIHPLVDRALVPVAGLLLGVVALVLLIACANLASFLLARATERRREIAVRLALGASRGRLVRQLLTETLVLAALGGGLGLLAARGVLIAVERFKPPLPFPIHLALELDAQVIVFTVVLTVVAGVLFGLAPALRAARTSVAAEVKGERGSERARGLTVGNGLVVVQVALSMVLLVGAGLFLRVLIASQEVDPGFGHEPAALVHLSLPADRYGSEASARWFTDLETRVGGLPGIRATALTDMVPLGLSVQTRRVGVPGWDPPPGEDGFDIDHQYIDDGYLAAMGIPLLAGRGFDARDTPEAPPSVIVNEAFAQRFWPGQDPVGRTVQIGRREATVVGVVATTRVRTLGEAPRPQILNPYSQDPIESMTLVARSDDPEAVLSAIVREARALEPDVVVVTRSTLTQHLATMLFAPRAAALLLGVMGALALVLATIGLYGLVRYTSARRTREVGIRVSLGATGRDVTRLLVKGGLGLVGVGGGVGLLLAFGAAQLIRSLLVGVGPVDPVAFAGIPLLFGLVAALAAWLPARRAARVDPVEALRAE